MLSQAGLFSHFVKFVHRLDHFISELFTTMDTKPEPLLSRLILTPVLFITFLVSLLFVDRKAYSQVVAGHVPQDSYYHSHQRKLARREVEDAFHMRNRAMAALLIATGIGLAFLGWTGSKVIHALFPARVVM